MRDKSDTFGDPLIQKVLLETSLRRGVGGLKKAKTPSGPQVMDLIVRFAGQEQKQMLEILDEHQNDKIYFNLQLSIQQKSN